MVVIVAVMDDVYAVGLLPALRRFFAAFADRSAQRGLVLNREKCTVLWPDEAPQPAELLRFAQENGFEAPVSGAMAWVGAAVGKDRARMQQIVNDINSAAHSQMFEALSSGDMGSQNALLMLRACILPRATYALRTAAPELVADFATQFDRSVTSTLAAIAQRRVVPGSNPFAVAGDSYRLPVSRGGIGLRSAAAVSSAAFISSVALSIGHMSAAQRQTLAARGVVHDGVADALQSLRTAGADCVLYVPQPPKAELKTMTVAQRDRLRPRPCHSVRDFVRHYAEVSAVGLNLQRKITSQFEAFNRAQLCADRKTRARLDSAGDKNAYKWLTTPPSEPQFRMADIEVVRALRHRIGIAPMDGRVQCKCGVQVTDENFDHFHSCIRVRTQALDARHAVVLRTLARITAAAGVQAQFDYASHSAKMASGSRLRPDGRFFGLHSTGADLVTDVSLTNPTSNAILHHATARLGAAKVRESEKCDQSTDFPM